MKNDLVKKFLEYYKLHKERTLIAVALLLTSLTFLWIFEKPAEVKEGPGEPSELGVSVPKGYLVVPLELANSKYISMMVSRMGVVDVFTPTSRLLAKNLRILKLSNEEASAFGALVPENRATELQGLFSNKNLKAALRTLTNEPTQFFSHDPTKAKIETYFVQE